MISAIGSAVIQNTWGRLSKEKVIAAAIASIACFALYKTYQSLVGRIEQLTTDLNGVKKEVVELKKKQLKTDHQIKELDRKIAESRTPYESCEEDDQASDEGDRAQGVVSNLRVIKKSPKELFLENFPGQHLKYPGGTLADVLLKTLFRIDALEECWYDEDDHSYTLTYKESKTIVIQDLPANSLEKMNSVIAAGLSAALSYRPQIEISSMFKVSFIQEAEGVEISFEKTAVTILPFWILKMIEVTGNLKSMFIPKSENEDLIIEFEHTVPKVPQWGHAPHDDFASMLPFFFNPTS